jgi:hypothetical protein
LRKDVRPSMMHGRGHVMTAQYLLWQGCFFDEIEIRGT